MRELTQERDSDPPATSTGSRARQPARCPACIGRGRPRFSLTYRVRCHPVHKQAMLLGHCSCTLLEDLTSSVRKSHAFLFISLVPFNCLVPKVLLRVLKTEQLFARRHVTWQIIHCHQKAFFPERGCHRHLVVDKQQSKRSSLWVRIFEILAGATLVYEMLTMRKDK